MKPPATRRGACVLAALAMGAAPARAQTAESALPKTESIPTSILLGFESIQLPQGEKLGLVGTSVLFQVGESWGFGPAVYGAASGERGGFFVGGFELQYRAALAKNLSLATGLYAGGGGGGAAPVGSGLMLRPAATLLYDLGPAMQVGLSWSIVKFPSGEIDSRQFGLVFAWRDEYRHYDAGDAGQRVFSGCACGFGFERMAGSVGTYQFTDGSERRIGLVGVRAERRTGVTGVKLGIEASAAARGDAAGYMEILGNAGWSIAPVPEALPSLRLGLRGAFGLGGGGAVPTGGGAIAKAAATLEFSPARGWSVGIDGGVVHALNGTLRARTAQAWIGMDLEPATGGSSERSATVVRTEWTGALQHHARVERSDGSVQPLDTIGLKLTRYVTPSLYITGQAHSAYAGGAGAYSIGLLGAGVATRSDAGRQGAPRVGFEALVGAAGGGGVATSGGAIAQGVAWAGWGSSANSEWRVGLGAERSLHGALRSPIVELSWTRAFGLAGG